MMVCSDDRCMEFYSTSLNWSKTTLNYWMMVERYPNPKEEVGGSIPGCEISTCQVANCLVCFGASLSVLCLKKNEKKKLSLRIREVRTGPIKFVYA